MSGDLAIVGVGIHPFGRNEDVSGLAMGVSAARTALADAGISCNVIAGLAHDHLFVGWEQGEQARALLARL